jgi:peptidoglycan/xylan/chitin deacetylase (PgdA/CDA1 family)
MRIRGFNRVRQIAQNLKSRFVPGGVILMYHRVAEKSTDPWRLCVTPENFAAHLEILQKHARPLRLAHLAQSLQEGAIQARAAVITFDDGYANNLHVAKPLLERQSIPATVFVTAGYVGKKREFWWDELDRALLRPGALPPVLSLRVNGTYRELDVGVAAVYSDEDFDHDCAHDREPSHRIKFYYRIWELLQPLSDSQRQKAMDEILTWAGDASPARPSHCPLLPDEVCSLTEGGLVDVGAHTMSHALLSAHTKDFQQAEIRQSKVYLEELLGNPVTSFCYPFGKYSEETVSLVREAGFTCACSIIKERVQRRSDRFQLPRFSVLDWGGDEFEKRLLGWFHGRSG